MLSSSVTQQDIRRLFGARDPVVQGPEVEIVPGRHALDLPADSDTRLLGGAPTMVTRVQDGLVARDADSGEQLWHYRPPAAGAFTWATSQDGRFLAVRQDNRIEVVASDKGEAVQSLELPPEAELSRDPVARTNTVRFGPGHTVMADYKTVGRDGGRSWAEHNLAFYDLEGGRGPAIAHMGSVGFMAFAPVIAPDGNTLLCDDSYGLKALDLGDDSKMWSRNDLRNLKSLQSGPEGRMAVLHSGGLDIVESETGKSVAQKKGWLADDMQVLTDRMLVRDWRNQSMTSVGWDGAEQWKLALPDKAEFRQVIATDDLIYATVQSEQDEHQIRLLLADPRTGDVLAQSQPLGYLRHGLPMFQAQDKVYLALEGGAISFSPGELELDQLKKEAGQAHQPAAIEVGRDFVQVGGVRLKSRG